MDKSLSEAERTGNNNSNSSSSPSDKINAASDHIASRIISHLNNNNIVRSGREKVECKEVKGTPPSITQIKGTESDKGDKLLFVQSSNYVFAINGINSEGKAVTTYFSFSIKINAITLDVSELLSGIGEVNSRDTFYQYIKMRAGKASFFRDVMVNIDALRKMAKRNASGRLEDRIISQLISGSNVLLPDFFKDLYEFKKFTVVISLDDADILKSEYNLSVYNSSDLYRMFNNMSMLSLIVCDLQDSENLGITIFDSDKPNTASLS